MLTFVIMCENQIKVLWMWSCLCTCLFKSEMFLYSFFIEKNDFNVLAFRCWRPYRSEDLQVVAPHSEYLFFIIVCSGSQTVPKCYPTFLMVSYCFSRHKEFLNMFKIWQETLFANIKTVWEWMANAFATVCSIEWTQPKKTNKPPPHKHKTTKRAWYESTL